MSIDPYAPCPCGSGKKLKFCCADLAGDIEKIHTQIQSDQPRAALRRIERLLEKNPNRASLVDLQASVLLSLEDFDAAATTIKGFLDAHPDTPIAHAQTAILLAAKEHPVEAIAKVQDALDRLDGDMPMRVLEAIGAVGHALLISGDYVAARAHLILYVGIAGDEHSSVLELLMRLNLEGGLPLQLRELLRLQDCDPSAPWKPAFDDARRLAARGQWRRAEALFAQLVGDDRPSAVYNLAVVRGWLGNAQGMAESLHRFGRMDVNRRAAEEAEALAQLVDPQFEDVEIETVQITFAIDDEEKLVERFSQDRRVERLEFDLSSHDDADGPRPRATYLLLDRDALSSTDGLTVDTAPNVIAFVTQYGKRTDCEARLEVTTDRDESYNSVIEAVVAIGDGAVGPERQAETIGGQSTVDRALVWRWRLPDDTPPSLRRRLGDERRRRAILEDWPSVPQAALGGKSPREAAGDAELEIPLAAAVLVLEQTGARSEDRELLQELRNRLQLPQFEVIDPDNVEMDRISIVRVPQLDLAKLTDDQLAKLLDNATMIGSQIAGMAVAEELVSRDSASDLMAAAYRYLIRHDPDLDRACQRVEKARKWAALHEEPSALWALLDLKLQIERRDAKRAEEVLSEIRTKHGNEPGVSEAVYQILHAAGLAGPAHPNAEADGRLMGAPDPPEPQSQLWTPGGDVAAAQQGDKPAIWTP